nr:retrovirus-related Pol polyprotein from transposon TNT 1-94 [Tanacetum cinerariifolium]
MALPEDHLAKFHKMADEKEMWEAIKSRFGGNDKSKKMGKYLLRQQFEGTTASSSSNTQNVAFLSADNTISTNNINDDDLEEMDLKWQVAMISMRIKKFHKGTKTVELKGIKIAEEEMVGTIETKLETIAENLPIRMIQKLCDSGSDNEVKSCSKTCAESYARLKKLYDEQRDKLGNASLEITAYTLALKKDDPHKALNDKGIIGSGCSRHMIGNKAYLADYQDIKGGSVAFGGSNGRIIGKQHKASCKAKTDETTPILTDFIRQAKNQFNHKVKTIRSDNGTEFKNHELIEFCRSTGIKREYSNAKTPQQNKVAERQNMTLIEAAKTILADSFLPTTFWAEAVNTTCYVLNRVIVTKSQNKTLYELLTSRQPIISYLRPFRCHVTILNTIDQLSKFDGKSDSGFLVGYSLNSKAFRIYNLETKRVEENLHVNFLENKPNVAGKGHVWMFDLDYLINSMNYEPISLENQANKSTGPQEANISAGTQANDDQGTNSEEIDLDDEHFVLPIWSAYSTTVKSSGHKIQKTIDCKTSVQTRSKVKKTSEAHAFISRALEDESWVDAMQEELLQFQIQKDERGVIVRNKARLVAQGHRHEEGIGYDESAFLYGTINDEVYVTQPPGFVDPKFPNKVYKVVKALYGLHQAPRACVKTASTPIETQKPLVKDEEADDVVVHLYRYLKGQPKLGLWYLKVSSFDLEAYSDSDYAGVNLDRKSIIGGCQFLGRRLISWQYKKQTIMATSTSEAEYVATAHCSTLLKGRLLEVTTAKHSKELASPKQMALAKPTDNEGFEQIIDFLNGISVRYALTASPTIRTSCIKQFWSTDKVNTVNDEVRVQALIDAKRVNIKESSIRRALKLDDEEGTSCLANAEFFTGLATMGYEKISDKLTFYKAFFSPL